MDKGYWFKSELFKIQKNEDQETNPLCYGKELAEWLCAKFLKLGYQADVIPEDWGWCVMCRNDAYYLWVGCAAMHSEYSVENYNPDNPPRGNTVIWHTFPHFEIPIFMVRSLLKKWTGKLDSKAPLAKLKIELEGILKNEKRIQFCEQP